MLLTTGSFANIISLNPHKILWLLNQFTEEKTGAQGGSVIPTAPETQVTEAQPGLSGSTAQNFHSTLSIKPEVKSKLHRD